MNIRALVLFTTGFAYTLISHADADSSRAHAPTPTAATKGIITDFIAACAAQDGGRLARLTTDDLRVEYALDTPGTYYAIDASDSATECSALSGMRIELSSVRLYPTADQEAMFVQYERGGELEIFENRQQLALIELRDQRIARILSFSPPSGVVVTAPHDAERQDLSAVARQTAAK
jgi:hypothetical protein